MRVRLRLVDDLLRVPAACDDLVLDRLVPELADRVVLRLDVLFLLAVRPVDLLLLVDLRFEVVVFFFEVLFLPVRLLRLPGSNSARKNSRSFGSPSTRRAKTKKMIRNAMRFSHILKNSYPLL